MRNVGKDNDMTNIHNDYHKYYANRTISALKQRNLDMLILLPNNEMLPPISFMTQLLENVWIPYEIVYKARNNISRLNITNVYIK